MNGQRCWQADEHLHYSRRALEIARNAQPTRTSIERHPCKVLPVALLARLFSISPRLLWNWIGKGLLERTKPPLKSGVLKTEAIRFLERLEDIYPTFSEVYPSDIPTLAGRPAKAQEKIRRAQLAHQGRGMTPRDFAGPDPRIPIERDPRNSTIRSRLLATD